MFGRNHNCRRQGTKVKEGSVAASCVTEPLSVAALTATVSVFVCRSDRISGFDGEAWSQSASRAHPYPSPPHHGDPQLDLHALVSLETDSSGEEGIEETIVYLWALSNTQRSCGSKTGERWHSVHAPPAILCTTGCFFCPFPFCFFSALFIFTVKPSPFPCNTMSFVPKVHRHLRLPPPGLSQTELILCIENNLEHGRSHLKDELLKQPPKFFEIVYFIFSGAWLSWLGNRLSSLCVVKQNHQSF